MRNIKLEIEYDGTNYCGWQIQKSYNSPLDSHKSRSIQEVIEKNVQRIIQEKIKLIASGRTDAGVHALGQVVNFTMSSSIPLRKLKHALNRLLPSDIAIINVEEVALDFHSRFCAKSKIYRYTILNRDFPSPFLKNQAYFFPYPLDLGLMRKESKVLLGRHDFRAFCASNSSTKNTIRTIKKIVIKKSVYNLTPITYNPKEHSLISIEIEADGFLYNMVRNIVGTLIEIGRGRFKKGYLKRILRS
ncbi:MAG: tRNA pseudouridine(38-40) synthase TruA [Candidatus Omnitrophica bacterium]|nr:tRNA pseudouridine(38-40) synthase TruA [Candidatus Omnitrophota bacterium]